MASSSYEKYLGNPDNINKCRFKSEQAKQATIHLLSKLGKTFESRHRKVLRKVPGWEGRPESKGEFLFATLKDQILQLDAELALSAQGGMAFLSDYPELFPEHINDLCEPLRLFVKSDPSVNTNIILHLVADYNEISISDEGFSIESEIQQSQAILTVKTTPDAALARRCFRLFTLLNGSEIFNKLPDREILIEIITLVRENYTSLQGEGVVITLVKSPEGFTLKFVQSEQNRIMLKAGSVKDGMEIRFMGDIPCHQNTQRQLFKLLSLFFSNEKKEPRDNAWRFACMEAVSQLAAEATSKFKFDLVMAGRCWGAEFAANTVRSRLLPPKSRQTLTAGADKVDISSDGREIRILRDVEAAKETEIFLMEKGLGTLDEKAVLEEVKEVKAQEASRRKIKMEQKYQQAIEEALQAYEEETSEPISQTIRKKKTTSAKIMTLEELASSSSRAFLQGKKTEDPLVKKIKKIILASIGCFIILVGIVFFWAMSGETPPGHFIEEIEDYTKTPESVARRTAPPSAPKVEDARLPNPGAQLITWICSQISTPAPPSQEKLNGLLKVLYEIDGEKISRTGNLYQDFEDLKLRLRRYKKVDIKESPTEEIIEEMRTEIEKIEEEIRQSGDFYNLMGRLYWYKIAVDSKKLYLDLSAYQGLDIFQWNWAEEWRQKAQEAFAKAEKRYEENRYQTAIKIMLARWNPESEADREQIYYTTGEEAIADVKKAKTKLGVLPINPWAQEK